MKKQFKNFAIIWLAGVILFSAIVLVVNIAVPSVVPGVSFWAAYAMTIIAYAIQMAVAYKFFKEENKDKVFLNMPLLKLSERCVVVSMIIGTILMVIPPIPFWIAPIVAVLILVFYIITITKAESAGEAAEAIGEKAAAQTEFIKEMTVKAQNAVLKAKTDEGKAIAEKVYEAIRYSNKSSHGGLNEVESKISANFTVFEDALVSGDDNLSKTVGEQLVKLAQERNNLAKLNK